MPRLEQMIQHTRASLGEQHNGFLKNVNALQAKQHEAVEVMNNTHKKFLREKSDLQSQFKDIYERLEQVDSLLSDIQRQEEAVLKVVEFGLQGELMKYYLDQQDELDRRSMSLYGVQDRPDRESSGQRTGRLTLRGSLE